MIVPHDSRVSFKIYFYDFDILPKFKIITVELKIL